MNHIVESMTAADNIRNQQSTANGKTGNFSDYLDFALSNYQTGLLTGGLNAGYSYMNALSGSAWQTVVLEALRDELKKKDSDETKENRQEEKESESLASAKKKSDWARIRVIEHYKSPREEQKEKVGILV